MYLYRQCTNVSGEYKLLFRIVRHRHYDQFSCDYPVHKKVRTYINLHYFLRNIVYTFQILQITPEQGFFFNVDIGSLSIYRSINKLLDDYGNYINHYLMSLQIWQYNAAILSISVYGFNVIPRLSKHLTLFCSIIS